jgi:hypothetical protein
MRGLVRTSTLERGYYSLPVFRMDLSYPFSPAEILLRVETEDLCCILAEPHFVRRHVPIESHNVAGPQRLLQSGLPLQNGAFVKPPLAEQGRKNQGTQGDRQDGNLGPLHTLFDRQMRVPENADCEDCRPDNRGRTDERGNRGERRTKAGGEPEQKWAERANRQLRGPGLIGQENQQGAYEASPIASGATAMIPSASDENQ